MENGANNFVEGNRNSRNALNNKPLSNLMLDDNSSDEDDDFVKKISFSDKNVFDQLKNEKEAKRQKSNLVPSSDKENFLENRINDLFEENSNSKNMLSKATKIASIITTYNDSNAPGSIKVNEQKTEVDNKKPNNIDLNFSFDVNWNDDISDVFQSELNQNVTVSSSSIQLTSTINSEPSTSSDYNKQIPKFVFKLNTQSSLSDKTGNLNTGTGTSRMPKPNAGAQSIPIERTLSDSALCERVNFPDRPTILVDSKELAGGKPIISLLRNKYGVNPVVMQLASADYVISNRLAIERILDSEFSSSIMPVKVIDKVKLMCDAYENSFVIIQADCRKRLSSFNKLSSKYLQFSLNVNLHPTCRVLFSNSFEESAAILSDIVQKEQRNGSLIDVPVILNPSTQLLFEFYHSCPHVTPICALRFAYHFPVVSLFLNSSVKDLMNAGSISTRKAISVLEYFKSEILFDAYS